MQFKTRFTFQDIGKLKGKKLVSFIIMFLPLDNSPGIKKLSGELKKIETQIKASVLQCSE